MTYPDPRFISQDEQDREQMEQDRQRKARDEEEMRMRKEQERRERKDARRMERRRIEEARMRGEDIESLASSTQRSDRSFMSRTGFMHGKQQANETFKSDREGRDDDERKSESRQEGEDGQRELLDRAEEEERLEFQKKQSILSPEPIRDQEITNDKIMQELKTAHHEALTQKEQLMEANAKLQEQIFDLKKRKEGLNAFERQAGTDVSGMNEHKYMNTLAHVHQIRIDLKQTQDRYNAMAAELQLKLDEKQKKCNEIK